MQNFILFSLFVLSCLGSYAQEIQHCSHAKTERHLKIRKKQRAGAYDNSLLNQYDVHFYGLNFNAERNNTLVSGHTTIGATVTASSLDTFCFEFNGTILIDSILMNGTNTGFARVGNITYVLPAVPLPQNSNLMVQVFYAGDASVTGGSAIGDGYSTGVSQTWGNSATWSLSEPYSAYEWFPCKQFLQDKADSAWIFVTTSNQNRVASNGLLEGVDSLPNNKVRYRWKTHYPIDYYLISVAIARYVDYTIYAHPSALVNDSIPVVNYVYNNTNTLPAVQSKLDSVALVLEYFSDRFGLYPFYEEKYGNAMAPFSGGMEHQTMTSAGFLNNFSLNAHELMHQWWGDHVTCKTWSDIFINEGFASYGEYLAYEHFRGLAAAQNLMQDVHDNVLMDPDARIWFTDTNNVSRIFDSRLTYDKGNAICHTLRFVLGDSLFFNGLKNFQNYFSFATAGIDDLRISLENYTGLNLLTFFNQWIYGYGHPKFSVEYNSNGSQIILKVSQTTSNTSTPLFVTPLEIKCLYTGGDTTIRVDLTQNSQLFVIPSGYTITGLEIDPNNWLLNEIGSITRNENLFAVGSEYLELQDAIQVYPVPAQGFVMIENNLRQELLYKLRDVQGRVLQHGNSKQKTRVSLEAYPAGAYLLELQSSLGRRVVKLTKN